MADPEMSNSWWFWNHEDFGNDNTFVLFDPPIEVGDFS